MTTLAPRAAGTSVVATIAVRVVIDGTRCDGHGICLLRLPERISLDEWGYAVVDDTPLAGRRSLARARRAVRACPAHALDLVTCADPPPGPASADARPRVVG